MQLHPSGLYWTTAILAYLICSPNHPLHLQVNLASLIAEVTKSGTDLGLKSFAVSYMQQIKYICYHPNGPIN